MATYSQSEAPPMPTQNHIVLRYLLSVGAVLLIAVSFLAEMLIGGCPVP